MSVVTDLREADASIIGVQPSSTPRSYLGRLSSAIALAAERTRVNPAYLWGILGVETSYASNITTSSTGAQGAFQFEPGTAKSLGLHVKNTSGHVTDWAAFQLEAEAAGRLLHAYGYTRNKRRAIEAYNGGPRNVGSSATRTYYESVVRHAQTYARTGPAGGEAVEREKITREAGEPAGLKGPGGIIGELLAGLGGLLVTGVLLVAGMALVAFGIVTALRPREARA